METQTPDLQTVVERQCRELAERLEKVEGHCSALARQNRRLKGACVLSVGLVGLVVAALAGGGCQGSRVNQTVPEATNERDLADVRREEENRNRPHPDPTKPPTDSRFRHFSRRELFPYVTGEKRLGDWWMSTRVACAWFIWKTRRQPELRTELADMIVGKLHRGPRSQHALAYLARFLGPLGGREQILALLREVEIMECCYAPALVNSLAMCGRIEDVPALIDACDKEHDGSAGVVNRALEKLTGVEMPISDHFGTDKEKWQKWWTENKTELLSKHGAAE